MFTTVIVLACGLFGHYVLGAKDGGSDYITPFQFLGNLRPTVGKSDNHYEGNGPHLRPPNIVPVSPVSVNEGSQSLIGHRDQGFQNAYEPLNIMHPNDVKTVVIRNNQGPYGPDNSYGHDVYPGPRRKIIGYKTVLEKRRVAVITNKKVPVIRMKQVVEKVPVVRMVNRVVEIPKKH